jgi:hypothetical protein
MYANIVRVMASTEQQHVRVIERRTETEGVIVVVLESLALQILFEIPVARYPKIFQTTSTACAVKGAWNFRPAGLG